MPKSIKKPAQQILLERASAIRRPRRGLFLTDNRIGEPIPPHANQGKCYRGEHLEDVLPALSIVNGISDCRLRFGDDVDLFWGYAVASDESREQVGPDGRQCSDGEQKDF